MIPAVGDDELVYPPVFVTPIWEVVVNDDRDLSGLELVHGDEQGICFPHLLHHHRGTHHYLEGSGAQQNAGSLIVGQIWCGDSFLIGLWFSPEGKISRD